MWFNTELFKKRNLQIGDLEKLTAIKVKDSELEYFLNEDDLKRFESLNYIKYIKGKQSFFERVRLDKKGSDLLIALSKSGGIDEEAIKIKDWVILVYKKKNGGIVKNKAELERRIIWFKDVTGICGNFLGMLIQSAMNDTYDPECGQNFYDSKKENPRLILSNLAENLFWMPDSHFDKHYTLDKSPLFIYYENNKEYVEKLWSTYLDEDGNRVK